MCGREGRQKFIYKILMNKISPTEVQGDWIGGSNSREIGLRRLV